MATSALNLQLILDIALKHDDMDLLKKAIHAKGLLPKKLLIEAKKPADSPFASKAAAEYAAVHSIAIKGLEGTSKNGKLTVKDLKVAQAPAGNKLKISPSAAKYARDNSIDFSGCEGSGKNGTILLSDIKALESGDDSDSESDSDALKLSAAAERAMKQYEIDEDDIDDIEGSGKDGTILLKDLKDIIEEIKKEST
jgi:pyruvate/2-oxoglutarate dehydrogenase complex dihydrolipoamide acyltransferase (E2) component